MLGDVGSRRGRESWQGDWLRLKPGKSGLEGVGVDGGEGGIGQRDKAAFPTQGEAGRNAGVRQGSRARHGAGGGGKGDSLGVELGKHEGGNS